MTQDAPLALLPMYDWPEIRVQTDVFWGAVRDACNRRDIEAPERLTRRGEGPKPITENWPLQGWLDPGLLLGQTCGLPFARYLRGRVQLLGSPVYAIKGCDPGDYYSFVVATKGGPIQAVDDIRDTHRFAFNSQGSQSGFRVMRLMLEARGRPSQWLEAGIESGSHRQSVQAVGLGEADFAVIDAVSWRLAEQFEPQVDNVTVIGKTAHTPGLPLIAAFGRDPERLSDAVDEAISVLDRSAADALGLVGFRRRSEKDYLGFSDE